MKEKNSGITIISLVVTIIVLLIIAGISIGNATTDIESSKKNVYMTDLELVQHAVIERYAKYKLTKNADLLVGTKVEAEDLEDTIQWKNSTFDSVNYPEKDYYRLGKNDLKSLGVTSNSTTDSLYIVNYFTGEVYNETVKTTHSGDVLYITVK